MLYFAHSNAGGLSYDAPGKGASGFFGGPLWRDKAVRFVFVDEAGISERDPVTVVVGVIPHADRHIVQAEALIAGLLRSLPREFQSPRFSAKDVWGNPAYRDRWGFPDRRALLLRMMSIPRRMKMGISVGVAERGGHDWAEFGPDQSKRFFALDEA